VLPPSTTNIYKFVSLCQQQNGSEETELLDRLAALLKIQTEITGGFVKEYFLSVLDCLRRKVDYADIRILDESTREIQVKNGEVNPVHDRNAGYGIRVMHKGSWGFASSCVFEAARVQKTAEEAIEIAVASATLMKEKVDLSEVEAAIDSYETPRTKDPFEIPFEDKVALLLECDRVMRRHRGVKVAEGWLEFHNTKKNFMSTEGSRIEQLIVMSGGGISCQAEKNGDVQTRSFSDYGTRGYEFIESMNLPKESERLAEEASQLLAAPECPCVSTTLLLGGSQLALQLHESCGHPIELDRVLGTEAGFYGTSFLTLDKVGKFRYGSEQVTITADATLSGGLGSFAYDDEGVRAQRTVIVDEGIFKGYLTSRETTKKLGQRSNGCMRASSWSRIPLIRMTNVNLEPGDWPLEELMADTKEGILMDTTKSWSIDDRRLNFQFGCEIAWEIRGGKPVRMLKNPVYTGITPQFWGSCDAVSDRKHWRIWGVPNCGKGEPEQTMPVGHGVAPARFRGVQVGVKR
jgi:TldD protein